MSLHSNQLDTFLCVAQHGSFSKAANALLLTPAAVIKQINLLEHSLGITLFERSHRGITLTEAGAVLAQDGQRLVGLSEKITARVRTIGHSEQSAIRLGRSVMSPVEPVTDLWPAIKATSSMPLSLKLVSFENNPQNARDILNNMGDVLDVVISPFDEIFLSNCRCAASELIRTPIRLAVPRRHRLATLKRIGYNDLEGETICLIRRGWNGCFDRLRDDLQTRCPSATIRDFPFYDIDIFNECEARGFAVATIDTWASCHPLLITMPVAWDHATPFGILHAPMPTPHVHAFIEAMTSAYAKKPALK